MVSLIWLKRKSLDWSEFFFLKLFDLRSVNELWGFGRINARSFDGNHEMTSVLYEVSSVKSENTGLIWLSDICEDDINHRHEHSIFLWMSSILNDWDNIGSLFSHVNQISTGSLRELDSVNASSWSNEISNVRNSGSRSGSNIEHFSTSFHVNVTNTSNNSGTDLRSEWIPDSVLCFSTSVILVLNAHTFFVVNGLAWVKILGNDSVVLST